MKKPLILLYFIVNTLSLFAKQEHTKIITQIDSINDLAYQRVTSVNVIDALQYAQEALILSEEIDYSKGRMIAGFYIAQTLYHLGNYDESLKYLEKAKAEEYTKKNPLAQFEICRIRGRVYSNLQLDNQALKIYRDCFPIINKLKDENHQNYCRSLTYENLAFIFNKMEKRDSLQVYLFKNKELLESMPEEFVINNKVNMYTSLGQFYTKENQYHLANFYLQKSLDLANEYGFSYLSRTYEFFGDAELLRDSVDTALRYYQAALNNLNETKLVGEYPFLYQKIEHVYTLKSMEDSALVYQHKYVHAENMLSMEKVKSTNQALDILLSDERKFHESKFFKYGISTIIVFIIASLLVYLLLRFKNTAFKKKIDSTTTHLEKVKHESF